MDPTMPKRLPWGLLAWVAVAIVLFAVAPAPPERDETDEDAVAVRQREVDLVVERTRTWQQTFGDRIQPWQSASGHLAIVIDDMGRELHVFDKLLALPYPLTFSVLPGAVYAAGVQLRATEDRRRYREIWLHLPMEPSDPDFMSLPDEAREVFLRSGDSPPRLQAKIEQALERVPFAVGVNNHMGSRLTADRVAMEQAMAQLHERSLLFIDSRTTDETQAELAARALGVPVAVRSVFLDNDTDPAAIAARLDEAAELSRNAPTIAIGHPFVETAEVLADRLPGLFEQGIVVYPASWIVAHVQSER
jgi:hypothetical protein